MQAELEQKKMQRSKLEKNMEEDIENLEAEASSGTKARQDIKKMHAIEKEEWAQAQAEMINAHKAEVSELQVALLKL